MEPIKNTLANLNRETNTRAPRSFEDEANPSDELEDLRSSMRISSLGHTFDSFKVLAGTEEVFRAFKAIAQGETEKPFLFCYGGVGNGKTHLCEATVIELRKRGIFCRYYTVPEIMSLLKRAINREISGVDPDDLLQRFCQARALILDDLEIGTDWERQKLEMLIDARYRNRRLTVLVSNRDLDELEKWSDRIVSRLSDPDVSHMVLNRGEDYRRRP